MVNEISVLSPRKLELEELKFKVKTEQQQIADLEKAIQDFNALKLVAVQQEEYGLANEYKLKIESCTLNASAVKQRFVNMQEQMVMLEQQIDNEEQNLRNQESVRILKMKEEEEARETQKKEKEEKKKMIQQHIDELNKDKLVAVEQEDFMKAAQCKKQIMQLEQELSEFYSHL